MRGARGGPRRRSDRIGGDRRRGQHGRLGLSRWAVKKKSCRNVNIAHMQIENKTYELDKLRLLNQKRSKTIWQNLSNSILF